MIPSDYAIEAIWSDAFVVTLDTDWAPDFMLDAVAERLIKRQVKATWFLTHDSPAVRRLLENQELFEFGLHPNFLPGSSQGNSDREVFANLRSLLPQSRIMRTHGLVQSAPLLRMAASEFDIEIDVSLFLPGQEHLRPHYFHLDHDKRPLLRIPYFWEDDVEAFSPECSWDFSEAKYHVPGLKVFDFHPVHLYLNSDSMTMYDKLKQLGPLDALDAEATVSYINRGHAGVGGLFDELLEHIVTVRKKSFTISEIAANWRVSHENCHSGSHAPAV